MPEILSTRRAQLTPTWPQPARQQVDFVRSASIEHGQERASPSCQDPSWASGHACEALVD